MVDIVFKVEIIEDVGKVRCEREEFFYEYIVIKEKYIRIEEECRIFLIEK